MAAIYPVIQVKMATFTSTATPASMTFDAPLQSVNSSIIVCFGAQATSRKISSISDTESGSYLELANTGGTLCTCNSWISKNREGGNPTISITLNSATAGDWAIIEVANLSHGTTIATTLDPNGYGYNFTTSTSQVTNQYQSGTFAVSRSTDQFVFVVQAFKFSSTGTKTAGWISSEQQGTLYFSWKLSGAPAAIATFQGVSTSTNDLFFNHILYFDLLKPVRTDGLRPHPFSPGLAR